MDMEGNLEDIFDLKPILPEIYTLQQFSNCSSKLQQPESSKRITSPKHIMNSISSRHAPQEMIITRKHPPQELVIPKNSPQELVITKNPPRPTCPPPPAAATTKLISFENSDSENQVEMAREYYTLTPGIISFSSSGGEDCENDQYHEELSHKRVCTATRTPSQAQDHLIAERKRREKLGQLFIGLSKVVPGLKKLDKASLLEDAINYLKSLQERVKLLEEEEINAKNISSIAMNPSTSKDELEESSINNSHGSTSTVGDQSVVPEIKARISDRHVLIKICCKKQSGLMSRIPCEMEKMNLGVLDMRLMPFGEAALDITILAEMHSEFRGTVKEIVDHLQMVFLNPRDDHHHYPQY